MVFEYQIDGRHGIWSEMGPYGWIWGHIKTGRSPMAHDHFQNPLDPKKDHKNLKLTNKLFFSPGEATTKLSCF